MPDDGGRPLGAGRRDARRPRTLSVLAACAGSAGPVLFTAAWVVSSLRQPGHHPAARIQLSRLAAEDARDPQIMMAAFVVLGACLIGFGAATHGVGA